MSFFSSLLLSLSLIYPLHLSCILLCVVVCGVGSIFALKIQTPTRAFLLDNQGKTQSFLAPKFFLFLGRYLGFLRL